jgi:hypothetical protein
MNEPHRVIIKIAGAETLISRFQVSGVSVQRRRRPKKRPVKSKKKL